MKKKEKKKKKKKKNTKKKKKKKKFCCHCNPRYFECTIFSYCFLGIILYSDMHLLVGLGFMAYQHL